MEVERGELLDGAARRALTPDNINGERRDGPTFGELMGLVRAVLYLPDGAPPPGWDAGRDGSILKQLLRHASGDQVRVWITGLGLLRDAPGTYADRVEWLRPGEKLTLRALYHTRSGVSAMAALAHQAFWRRENTRPRGAPASGSPMPIAALLPKAAS